DLRTWMELQAEPRRSRAGDRTDPPVRPSRGRPFTLGRRGGPGDLCPRATAKAVVTRILIVDDVHAFAESASTLVGTRTGIDTDFATDPDEAMALIEREPVAVVVLDQKMPKMPGTELFQQMRMIRPDLRAIMLTGEASADEVGAAIQAGYHDYLAK